MLIVDPHRGNKVWVRSPTLRLDERCSIRDSSHTLPYLVLEIARVSVQSRLTAQVHIKHVTTSGNATFLDQLDHTGHTLSFIDGIGDQRICSRCKLHGLRCARSRDTWRLR